MLKNPLLLTFILLFKTILNNKCDKSSCLCCYKLGSTKFLNCTCSYCPKIIYNHECTQSECNFCRQYNKKTAFNCICAKCHFKKDETMKSED